MAPARVRTLIAMALATCADAVGAILLSEGMRQVGPPAALTPALLIQFAMRTVVNGHVWLGVAFLAVFYFLYMASLSWTDLSFVLPLTAATYVLVTLLGFLILGEAVSALRWTGTLLVSIGIIQVTRT